MEILKIKEFNNLEDFKLQVNKQLFDNTNYYHLSERLKLKIEKIKEKKSNYYNIFKNNLIEDEDTNASHTNIIANKQDNFIISDKIKNIIAKIKNKKLKNSERTHRKKYYFNTHLPNLNKYDDILNDNYLGLPYDLTNNFKTLKIVDKALIDLKDIKNTIYFIDIKDYLLKNYKTSISINNLLKIKFLSNWTYHITKKSEKYIIDFNSDYTNLNERYKNFEKDLYAYVMKIYYNYCKNNNIYIDNKEVTIWDHDFNLHDIKLIKKYKIIEDKSTNSCETKTIQLKKDDFKIYINKKLLLESISKNNLNNLDFKDRILKENDIKMTYIKSKNSNTLKIPSNELSNAAKILIDYYKSRDVSNMFISRVIEFLNSKLIYTLELLDYYKLIEQILDKFSNFGNISNNILSIDINYEFK